MTFPLDKRVELFLGDWVDITGDVYTRDPISITRGRREGANRVDPSSCTMTLDNRGGKYSPRNPRSPYYGTLGRNTPVRVSVKGDESYLALDGSPTGQVSTPDTAALDITGDIDVRVEATANWHGEDGERTLIGKYNPDIDDRSWLLRLTRDRNLQFTWIDAGNADNFVRWDLPTDMPERCAVRVTLDVDNGSGGHTVTAYIAPSLDGPWTFQDAITGAGPTDIRLSAQPLQIAPSYIFDGVPRWPVQGHIHRAEVRSGIDGPPVADPDFRALTEGTTSFTDPAGLVWTLAGTASIADRAYRFHGEVSEWPARWDVSGTDVTAPIKAAGILRRMGQGAPALQSTLRRRIPGGGDGQPGPLAYWPMEEGKHATQAHSPLEGVAPMRTSGLNWASDDSLFGSDVLPTLGQNSSISGQVPGAQNVGWHVDMSYKLDSLPASPRTMLRVYLGGSSAAYVQTAISTSGVRVEVFDDENNQIDFAEFGGADALDAFTNGWNRLQMFSAENGGTTYLHAYWRNVVTGADWATQANFVGSPGKIARVYGNWHSDLSGMSIGHIAAWDVGGSVGAGGSNIDRGVTYFDDADDGFEHEFAFGRVTRVANEEDLTVFIEDGPDSTELVGPQRVQSVLELLGEAASADGGLLLEHRRTPNLAVRFRSSMYNQTPALTLDYASGREVAPPLEPVDDDQNVANDVTVTRQGGSSGRAVLETGPLSVQAPPNGIGLVNESVTLNLAADSQTEPMAFWRMHLGTVDEARYPTVLVNLHGAPHLIPQILRLDVLDRVQILNPPEWLPPGTIELLLNGYTEHLGVFTWEIELNCAQGSPWILGTAANGPAGTAETNRADTSGSVLATDVTDVATELLVHTTDGPTWVRSADYPGDFPFNVSVGGEVARVSAIEPMVSDTFTRSVTDGWGTSTSGTAWVVSGGGGAPDFDVNGTQGTIHLAGSPGLLRFGEIIESLTDGEILVSVAVDQLPAAGDYLAGAFFRAGVIGEALVLYWCNLALQADGNIGLEVRNTVTPVGARVATGLTFAPGTRIWMRARADGNRVRGRVWLTGTVEPGVWHIDRTVTADTVDAGTLGFTVASTDGTSTTPLFMVDDFEVVTPQRFTVQRSINGLTKPHTAGAGIRLAQPAIVAL